MQLGVRPSRATHSGELASQFLGSFRSIKIQKQLTDMCHWV